MNIYSVKSLSDLAPYFKFDNIDASHRLGCSPTTLKKKARELGIKCWPYRKFKAIENYERTEGVSELTENARAALYKDPNIKLEEILPKKLRKAVQSKMQRAEKNNTHWIVADVDSEISHSKAMLMAFEHDRILTITSGLDKKPCSRQTPVTNVLPEEASATFETLNTIDDWRKTLEKEIKYTRRFK